MKGADADGATFKVDMSALAGLEVRRPRRGRVGALHDRAPASYHIRAPMRGLGFRGDNATGPYDAFGVFRTSLPQKTGVFHSSSRNEAQFSPNAS
jgi:hypothetical protein